MLRLALSDCARILGLGHEGADPEIVGVSIDTRTLPAGALYVAIRGDRHDGHDFVAEAARAGARAAVVERAVEASLPQLRVEDSRVALGALAGAWARRLAVPTVAITGSNGKTTVKEIVASILGEAGAVLATRGNLNNDIGVPLTLLGLEPAHRHAVIEMGANHAGEIAALAALAAPRVALVNNVGPAHLEGFGSIDGVAAAKSEIYGALDADGCALINADDAFAPRFRAASAHCRRLEFGRAPGADVRELDGGDGRLHVATPAGTLVARFALAGRHNRANALAAVACACALGMEERAIVAGLEAVRGAPGRLERKRAASGATLIDDSYNANPASARAALEVLAEAAAPRHLVLGEMGELGEGGRALHAEIGAAARAAGIDALWTLGALAEAAQEAWRGERGGAAPAAGSAGGHFDDAAALARALAASLEPAATVLIKGSRAARMERVVAALERGGGAP